MGNTGSAITGRHAATIYRGGERVFDEVTRLEGVVQESRIAQQLDAGQAAGVQAGAAGLFRLPTRRTYELVTIRLSDGSRVERKAAQVHPLPAGLSGALADYAPPKGWPRV